MAAIALVAFYGLQRRTPPGFVPGVGNDVSVEKNRSHFDEAHRITDVRQGGYSTTPPTSGRHWNDWARCGFCKRSIPDELLVQNLEHGNILLSYNLVDPRALAILEALFDTIPEAADWGIARYYDRLPSR